MPEYKNHILEALGYNDGFYMCMPIMGD